MRSAKILKANHEGKSNAYIPEEIILEILKELPAKSLLKFRCVSKHWRCVIDNPDFVNMHRLRSYNRAGGVKLILKYLRQTEKEEDGHFASLDLQGNKLRLPNPTNANNYILHSQAVEGLVCLGHERIILNPTTSILPDPIIWNPTTRKFIRLPPLLFKNLSIPVPWNVSLIRRFELGFDSRTKQYKVLGIHEISPFERTEQWRRKFYVQVLTIGTNVWKNVSDYLTEEETNDMQISENNYYVEDKIYFLVKYPDRSALMVFSVGNEKFRFFDLPDSNIDAKSWRIYEVKGHAALMGGNGEIIWILSYFETTANWEKIVRLGGYTHLYIPNMVGICCTMRNSDEFLILSKTKTSSEDNSFMFSYHYHNEITRRTRTGPNLLSERDIEFCYDQVETLFDPTVLERVKQPHPIEDS